MNYIITNSFNDQKTLTGILKTNISNHYRISTISTKHRLDSAIKSNNNKQKNKCWIDARIKRYFISNELEKHAFNI